MSHAPSQALEARHAQIRKALAGQSLDALVVTALPREPGASVLPNVLYLTNFTGSSGIVVLTRDRLFFITDFRYVAALAETGGTPHECPGLELVTVTSSYDGALADLLAKIGGDRGARIGFEAANLPVSRHQWLLKDLQKRGASTELVATEGIVERARLRKDDYELGVLREAARRLSGVARDVGSLIKVGKSERDVAYGIDMRIRDAGFEKMAFDTIVATGPSAALPHARPGDRRISEGDLVVLDFGGVYDSYCVDLTRTVAVGRVSTRAREVYDAVLRSHDQAIRAVKPGVSRFAVDAAARDVLAAAGMGEAFGHGTGHGLGIEVHEEPRISKRRPGVDRDPGNEAAEDAVQPGMVFTIEPGAYFAGWSGVRIEDDVLVTGTGVEVLTDVTTDLVEI